jgi:SAM-dependent methyltransferase
MRPAGRVDLFRRMWVVVKPTRSDIELVYRNVLGRAPESASVVDQYLEITDLHELYRIFINSDEFVSRVKAAGDSPPLHPLMPELKVQVQATSEQMKQLLRAVGAYWRSVGQTEPHWSVITDDRFRSESVAENEEAFWELGRGDLNLMRSCLKRFWANTDRPARLLVEFGCGVGRATLQLSSLFDRVVACDISAAHLAKGEERAGRLGIGNVEWFQVNEEELLPNTQPDVWYSRLVLQHNPPPLQRYILERALERLAPGGLAIFQTPTYWKNYSFNISEYLGHGASETMEMHVLPQQHVLQLAQARGCNLMMLAEDTAYTIGDPAVCRSNLFVFRKKFKG